MRQAGVHPEKQMDGAGKLCFIFVLLHCETLKPFGNCVDEKKVAETHTHCAVRAACVVHPFDAVALCACYPAATESMGCGNRIRVDRYAHTLG